MTSDQRRRRPGRGVDGAHRRRVGQRGDAGLAGGEDQRDDVERDVRRGSRRPGRTSSTLVTFSSSDRSRPGVMPHRPASSPGEREEDVAPGRLPLVAQLVQLGAGAQGGAADQAAVDMPTHVQRAVRAGRATVVGRAVTPGSSVAAARRRAGCGRRRARCAAGRSSASGQARTSRPRAMMTTSSTVCSTSASTWLDTRTVRPWRREVAQEAAQPGDALGVQAVGRLVEDQHARVAEQRRRPARAAGACRASTPPTRRRRVGRARPARAPRRRARPATPPARREHAQVVARRCGRGGSRSPRARRRRVRIGSARSA